MFMEVVLFLKLLFPIALVRDDELRCLADLCIRKPNTLGTYTDSGASASGTKFEKVMRNRWGNVVPKDAPSTAPIPPRERDGGG